MRNAIVALLLLVAIACQRADTEVDEEETAAGDTTVAETAPAPPPPGPTRQGTVGANGLTLGWHNDRACIEIPPDAVAAGTVITIELVGNVSQMMRDQAGQQGFPTVLPPVFEFSADPAFEIQDPDKRYTMGICANSGAGNDWFPTEAEIARFGDAFATLDSVAPPGCLKCRQGESARARSSSLLSGSFLDPTPLHAAPLAKEGGIGGRGTGLSTFAVVSREVEP